MRPTGLLILVALAAATMLAACGGSSNTTPAAPIVAPQSTSGPVVSSGTTASIPMPGGVQYPTTVTLTNADVIGGTTFTAIVTSGLSGAVPVPVLPKGASVLETVALTGTQDIGADSVSLTVGNIPNSAIAAGSSVYAGACLPITGTSACDTWYGSFGAGTVTQNGNTSSVALTVPITVLDGGVQNAFVIFTAPTGATMSSTRLRQAVGPSVWTTSGRQVLLNGNPFFAKGVAYEPFQIGWCPGGCAFQNPDPYTSQFSSIWTADLASLSAMGANALRIYDIANTNNDDISAFINAAAANNMYVLLEVNHAFGAPAGSSYDAATLLAIRNRYDRIARKYGALPGVMGFIVGNEIFNANDEASPQFWAQLNKIVATIKTDLQILPGAPQKLVTTAAVDDGPTLPAMTAGVANNFKVDVWGYNVYRGPTFGTPTTLWTQVASVLTGPATKPFWVTEYGTPVSLHPDPNYTCAQNAVLAPLTPTTAPAVPPQPGAQGCQASPPNPPPPPPLPSYVDVKNYVMGSVVALDNQNAAIGRGIASGGFYFEWSDEWWKAASYCSSAHCGGSNGNALVNGDPLQAVAPPNAQLLFNDQAWYGLNAISLAAGQQPTGFPNVMTPRLTYCILQLDWTGSSTTPCSWTQ